MRTCAYASSSVWRVVDVEMKAFVGPTGELAAAADWRSGRQRGVAGMGRDQTDHCLTSSGYLNMR